ncbi:MAG: hypothetical protein JNK12_14910 [Acidimicrobiales bacterium]|nr:hypothetical protein [Acidimicrobiales bacterium]
MAALAVSAPTASATPTRGAAVETVQQSPNEPTAVQVTAGTDHSCALLGTGEVKCWGGNAYGQLGVGDTDTRGDTPGELGDGLPPVDLGADRTATAIAAAGHHTCALLDDGTVKCWGMNDVGQLGQDDTFGHGYSTGQMGDTLAPVDLGEGRTAVAITAAARGWHRPSIGYTCALLDDGSVKCWGGNAYGQLGQGVLTPLGDQDGEMAALAPVDLGPGRTALAVDAGAEFACAIRDTHDVVCWGETDGVHTDRHDVDDSVGDDPGEMGSALVPVNLGPGRTATAISVSDTHACALRDDQRLVCWGQNNDGQLGIGTTTPAGLSQPLPDDHPSVDLGTGRTAVALTTGGYHHTCVLLDDQTVKCWGDYQRGTLGTGDLLRRGDGPDEMGDALLPIDLGPGRTATAVTLGDFHACAVLDDGTVKCWGDNERGQLGLGDTSVRGDAPGEMGDQLPAVDLGTPAPALAVDVTADQTEVEAGSAIDYHVTVTNTGNVDLSGVTVVDPAAPACASDVGTLTVRNAVTVDCSYTTAANHAGTYTNVATADSDQTEPVDSTPVDVTVTLTHQPDLALKLAGRAFVGGDAYGRDGAAQAVDATRRRGGRATFYVRIENDGAVADTFDLRRVGTSPGVDVRFFRGRTATDLTGAVVGRTYLTRPLAPGQSVLVRVEAVASAGAAPGTRSIVLRSRSTTETTRVDTVLARVTVR